MYGLIQRAFQRGELRFGKTGKHKIRRVKTLRPGTDAYTQTGDFIGAGQFNNIFHAFLSAGRAGRAQANVAQRQRHVVKADKLTVCRNFEKAYAERNKLLKENKSFRETSAAAKEAASKYEATVRNSNRLSEEYTKLKNDFEAFKQAVAKTNQASFSAAGLSVENESLKKEIAKLKSIQEKSGKNIGSPALANENARLKQELNALKLAVAGTENGKLAAEFAKLKELSGRNEQLLAENNKLKKEMLELKALTVKYRNLPADANSILKENENLKIEITSLKETVSRLMKMAENPQTSTRQIELAVNENTSLRTEAAKLKKHISMLNAELRENEMLRKNNEAQIQKLLASGKNSEEFLRQRDQRIKQLNAEIARLKKRAGVPASKEIAELSATVTELREGKVQFETALRNLTAVRTKLEEENRKLKTRLELAQRETDALKKQLTRPQPQGVLERRNLELLESATKFESLYAKTSKERDELAARLKELDKEILNSKNQLNTANVTMERMRKELLQWTDDPTGMSDQTIHRKDQAIDVLVAEGEALRKEVARLKTMLLVANDTARRYREKTVEMEQRFRQVLSSIKDYKDLNPDRVINLLRLADGKIQLDSRRMNYMRMETGAVSLKDKAVFILEQLKRLL